MLEDFCLLSQNTINPFLFPVCTPTPVCWMPTVLLRIGNPRFGKDKTSHRRFFHCRPNLFWLPAAPMGLGRVWGGVKGPSGPPHRGTERFLKATAHWGGGKPKSIKQVSCSCALSSSFIHRVGTDPFPILTLHLWRQAAVTVGFALKENSLVFVNGRWSPTVYESTPPPPV